MPGPDCCVCHNAAFKNKGKNNNNNSHSHTHWTTWLIGTCRIYRGAARAETLAVNCSVSRRHPCGSLGPTPSLGSSPCARQRYWAGGLHFLASNRRLTPPTSYKSSRSPKRSTSRPGSSLEITLGDQSHQLAPHTTCSDDAMLGQPSRSR